MAPLPKIKQRVVTTFPARVEGRKYITVEKSNGVYYFDFDASDIGTVPDVPDDDKPTSYVLVWDKLTDAPLLVEYNTFIGGSYQPLDPTLTAIAALTTAADKLIYATGVDTFALTDLTAAGRAILDDADAAAQRTTLGLGNVDNTADADKPVSTAAQTALDLKANSADLGTAATTDATDYATAAQGSTADTAVQPGDLAAVATSGSYGDLTGKPYTVPTGGTTSQVLAKASGTDGDTEWVDASAGGGSGTVTSISPGAGLQNAGSTSAITSSGTLSIDGAFGARNRLINHSGRVWQRQNSGAAAITDGTYAFDRWYGLTQSAGVTASQVTNAENGTPFMMRLSQANSTAQRFGIAQVVESLNCIDLRGQGVVLSARVRMSASTTLRYAVIGWAGTADSVTKDFVNDWTSGTFTAGNFFTSTNTNVDATGSIALTANTLTTISLTATVNGANNNVAVMFWTDSTQAQNVTLDIGKVQLEVGLSATPLANVMFNEMAAQCQRYYEKSYTIDTAPGSVATADTQRYWAAATSVEWFIPFKTLKRISPTVTVYSGTTGSSGNIRDVSGAADVAASGAAPSVQGFVVQKTAAGSAGSRYDAHWAANCEL